MESKSSLFFRYNYKLFKNLTNLLNNFPQRRFSTNINMYHFRVPEAILKGLRNLSKNIIYLKLSFQFFV